MKRFLSVMLVVVALAAVMSGCTTGTGMYAIYKPSTMEMTAPGISMKIDLNKITDDLFSFADVNEEIMSTRVEITETELLFSEAVSKYDAESKKFKETYNLISKCKYTMDGKKIVPQAGFSNDVIMPGVSMVAEGGKLKLVYAEKEGSTELIQTVIFVKVPASDMFR